MDNLLVTLAIVIVFAFAVLYLYKQKKKGKKCIGCPYCNSCKGSCEK